MDHAPIWIPVVALVISVATLLIAALGLRQKAGKDYADTLARRLELANDEITKMREAAEARERRIEECERDRERLREDVVAVQRRLRQLERGAGHGHRRGRAGDGEGEAE